MKITKHTRVLLVSTLLAISLPSQATLNDIGKAISKTSQEAWDGVSDVSKKSWDSLSKWSKDAFNTAGEWSEQSVQASREWMKEADKKLDKLTDPKSPAEAKKALDIMSETALVNLFNSNPEAKVLFDSAYGYAAFDSRRFALLMSANQGAGVAINRKTGQRTYMKMFGAGLSLGVGGKFYQQVIFFEDQATFDQFVKEGWEAASEAGVVAGKDKLNVAAKYNGGRAIYQINEKGLLIDANISGSKYWVDDSLMK